MAQPRDYEVILQGRTLSRRGMVFYLRIIDAASQSERIAWSADFYNANKGLQSEDIPHDYLLVTSNEQRHTMVYLIGDLCVVRPLHSEPDRSAAALATPKRISLSEQRVVVPPDAVNNPNEVDFVSLYFKTFGNHRRIGGIFSRSPHDAKLQSGRVINDQTEIVFTIGTEVITLSRPAGDQRWQIAVAKVAR